jgi:hypothetical protein
MRALTAALVLTTMVCAPAHADEVWSQFAGDAQHTGLSTVASQPLDGILWQTPVDLDPQYSGNDLLIHYGSPLVTTADTVVVPVKTGASDGFELQGRNGANGGLMWTQTTDYTLPPFNAPPHDWTPSFNPALAPSGRVYMPGAGGTIIYRDNPDSPSGTTGRLAFFGLANYNANSAAFNGSVYITTPITTDSAGNIYFGFNVTGSNPLGLQSGLARISATGVGSYVSSTAASGDAGLGQMVMNSAPAISPDGSTLYVAVSDGTRGDLVALNSTTLATTAVRPLKDPVTGNDAFLPDDSTASPTVGPDGHVYFGVLENPKSTGKGWLLGFNADLTPTSNPVPGAFGWDDTVSIVPKTMVPSYSGSAPYLLMTKYNNYADSGGDGNNRIAILDPTASMTDPRSGATVMDVVESIAGPTPDPEFPGLPDKVREWCINNAVVDPTTDSVLANSEDGKLYRWDLGTDTFTESVVLTPGIGEAYTPTEIGADGKVYAINNATLFAVGEEVREVPEPSTWALLGVGATLLSVVRRPRAQA